MENWMDIHCHCLPGVDDGAKDIEQCIAMLTQAYEDGIRQIIMTPHFHHRRGNIKKDRILEVLEEVKQTVKPLFPDLELYAGNELYYSSQLVELLENDQVHTMAGSKYVLIEFSPETDYVTIRNAMLQLQTFGYWPILAHVERYFCFIKKPDLAIELAQMGVYLQVNAGSIVAKYNWNVKRFLKKLWLGEHISFVATDAHDTKQRKQQLSACANWMTKKWGTAMVEQCLWNNPQAILKKERI